MTLLHVPVIDITPYREGTPEGKAAVAEQIGQACRDIGFLVVSGHGIPEDLIRKTYDVSKEFFALPHSENKTHHLSHGRQSRRRPDRGATTFWAKASISRRGWRAFASLGGC